ncbi:hypothetical protein O3P69_020740 [Scylla paramamosain]|uniref:Uncharacterized protein n=1 Tax=Scylla paramamosain TaxID=85552 RepID=A0AAW0TNU3_SCYPA
MLKENLLYTTITVTARWGMADIPDRITTGDLFEHCVLMCNVNVWRQHCHASLNDDRHPRLYQEARQYSKCYRCCVLHCQDLLDYSRHPRPHRPLCCKVITPIPSFSAVESETPVGVKQTSNTHPLLCPLMLSPCFSNPSCSFIA